MGGKYSLDEIVKYNNKIYRIVECHAILWFTQNDPFLYGMVLANATPREDRGDRIYAKEDLIKPLSDKEKMAWRLLYGKK